MLVGYARVSTLDQKLDRQIDQLEKYGIDRRNIYFEKVTGKKKERPELNRMISELVPGDIVIIANLTRISRSTRDLLDIVDKIKQKGAAIRSIKDTWLDTSSDNPYNDFLLTVMSGISQLERDLTSQRTREGLASAKTRGRSGGRPSKINEKSETVMLFLNSGYSIKRTEEETGISRSTIYRIKRNFEQIKL